MEGEKNIENVATKFLQLNRFLKKKKLNYIVNYDLEI